MLNPMNFAVSLALLSQRNLDRNKVLAASLGSALLPGMMGLVLPLALASTADKDGSGGTTDDSSPTVQTMVPSLVGKTQAEAEAALKTAGLKAQVSSAYFIPTDGLFPPMDTVATQVPVAGTFVEAGTSVAIEVSLGAQPATPDTGLDLDEKILTVETDIQGKISDMNGKVQQILDAVQNS